MLPGEGTRRAAVRWLELLRIADVPRARAVFTHHPDYADLTPVQYAEGLAWLRGSGLLDEGGKPLVRVSGCEAPESAAVPHMARVKWNEGAEAARRAIGLAGETAVLKLLALGCARRIAHVAAVSDSYGFDIDTESWEGVPAHLEVKGTTDPTRLIIHLTRHEHEVMRGDPHWLLAAVLLNGQGEALNLVSVDRDWLLQAAPVDRERTGAWESARFAVPGPALTPGLVTREGRRIIRESVPPFMPLWGVSVTRTTVPA
ncbi:protein NO VEIN domain-containing protein [Streptomyces sp. NPDC002564]|uniref:protein NO VEIN domain-containing protein n=1 Tax=Streptomyces sp. NPDC002564 TaxID=3364649 RepID=UPI0036BAFC45